MLAIDYFCVRAEDNIFTTWSSGFRVRVEDSISTTW